MPENPPSTPAPTESQAGFDPQWPGDPDARWPQGCYIQDLGVHPKLPWLTVACSKNDFGAIVILDVHAGSLVSVSTTDEQVGWENSGLALWDATGTRLATNADTNSIAVLESGAFVGLNNPNDARDHETHYAWVDHRIYTDTNNLFDPKHDEGWTRGFESKRTLDWTIRGFRWNANIGAVVGTVRSGEETPAERRALRLVAYAPARDVVVYDNALGDVGDPGWSPDGRWLITEEREHDGDPDIILIDGNHGQQTRPFRPKYRGSSRKWVSNNGDILVTSYARPEPRDPLVRAVELWRPGQPPTELMARDVSKAAWSPDAAGFALFEQNRTITLFDVATAKSINVFAAPIPTPPDGLPDWLKPKDAGDYANLLWVSPDRLAVVGSYYVSVYALDGSQIAQYIVPS